MNQILMVEKKKKSIGGRHIEIRGIVRFFAIFIILFGLILSGQGSYAIYKGVDERNPKNMPNVYLSRDSDIIKLKVEHSVEISKIMYKWNDGEENNVPEGTMIAEEEIIALDGNNILTIAIVDIKGREYRYNKEYLLEGIDITKPNVEIKQAEEGTSKISIDVTDETALLEMTYKVNDGQEIKIEVTEENQKEIKEDITIPEGKNTLIITAKDTTGNVSTYEQEIIVSTKPKIEAVSKEGSKLIIKISDEKGLKEVKVNLNGKEMSAKDINQKEIYIPLNLQAGNNILGVEVTNVNGFTGKMSTEIAN